MNTKVSREMKFKLYFYEGKQLTYSTHTFEVTDKRLHIMLARFEENTIVGFVEYTGLKDKNGKELWEGDIIKWDDEDKPEQVMHSLDWDGRSDEYLNPFMSAWGSTCGQYYRTFMNVYNPTKYATIIGNIYEHPNQLSQ